MKWEDREESENVEDRRGSGGKSGLVIAGGGGAIVVLILALIFGVDPQKLGGLIGGGQPPPAVQDDVPQRQPDPEEDRQAHFTKVIFHDTEVVWTKQFQRMDKRYEKPTLVLFTDQVPSACGLADAAVGPFYCPGDSKVYIDLGFYRDLQAKLKAPGDFARAYVIAHEVGHHVQRLLGYSARADDSRRGGSDREQHRMSVRLELQADYLAGVWAYYGDKEFHFLEKGDLEKALKAAFEIGDDRLMKKARGYVVPEKFTHGSSKQRMYWFRKGFDTGDVARAADLFDLPYDEL